MLIVLAGRFRNVCVFVARERILPHASDPFPPLAKSVRGGGPGEARAWYAVLGRLGSEAAPAAKGRVRRFGQGCWLCPVHPPCPPFARGGNAQRNWDELETCARRAFYRPSFSTDRAAPGAILGQRRWSSPISAREPGVAYLTAGLNCLMWIDL